MGGGVVSCGSSTCVTTRAEGKLLGNCNITKNESKSGNARMERHRLAQRCVTVPCFLQKR